MNIFAGTCLIPYIDMNQHKITILEDDASIREMYALKLTSHGFLVTTADNGESGLTLIEQIRPHLLLLDIKMPRLPGNEVLRRVREQEWGKEIKVIILTNLSKSEGSSDLRFLGVNRYILKVLHTPSQVVEIIKEVLNE
jgi:DNA-binding response OmpR family regulator